MGSGDERPSQSSKPRVGESGLMIGSMIGTSRNVTLFFDFLEPLGESSIEPADDRGVSTLVGVLGGESSVLADLSLGLGDATRTDDAIKMSSRLAISAATR